MANIIYVNVGGTWKTVSNYYVNVNGSWKTGSAFGSNVNGTWKTISATSGASFPTAVEVLGLEFAEFMCIPLAYVSSKQGVDGTSLDYAEHQSNPSYTRDSVFVYTAPPPQGPSTLPTVADIKGLDYKYHQSNPTIYFSSKAEVQMPSLDYAEFMCIPSYGRSDVYVPPPPPSISLPTAAQTASMDYAEFMCIPLVNISSKSTVDGTSLDYSEHQSNPTYTTPSTFVYIAPPAPGPQILPTAANLKTLDYAEYMSQPTVHVSSKSYVDGESLDYAEFMCIPHFTKNL